MVRLQRVAGLQQRGGQLRSVTAHEVRRRQDALLRPGARPHLVAQPLQLPPRGAAAAHQGARGALLQARRGAFGVAQAAPPGMRQIGVGRGDVRLQRLPQLAQAAPQRGEAGALGCRHRGVEGGAHRELRAHELAGGQLELRQDRARAGRDDGVAAARDDERLRHLEQPIEAAQHRLVGHLARPQDGGYRGQREVGQHRAQRGVGGQLGVRGRRRAGRQAHARPIGGVKQGAGALRVERRRVAVGRQRRGRLFQRAAHRRRGAGGAGVELGKQRPQQIRFQHHQAMAAEQPRYGRRRRAGKAAAARREQLARVRRERARGLALEEPLRGLPHLRGHRQLVDGAAGALPIEARAAHAAVRRQVVGVVDLAQIVILGGQPEHRHAAPAQLLLVAVRQANRGHDLVQSIGGAAHKAGLLAGVHAAGIGVGQRRGAGHRGLRRPEAAVVARQRGGQLRLRRARGPARAQRVPGGAGRMGKVAVHPPRQVVQVEPAAPVHPGHGDAVGVDQFQAGTLSTGNGAAVRRGGANGFRRRRGRCPSACTDTTRSCAAPPP